MGGACAGFADAGIACTLKHFPGHGDTSEDTHVGTVTLNKTLDDLRSADEIIVTSSSNFCLHACEVDGKPAGGKDPATLKAIQSEVLREYYAYTGKTTVVD